MGNAFPSTDHELLEQVIGEVIPDMQGQLFLQQRHREAVMEIQAGGARHLFARSRSGHGRWQRV
eukprot:6037542-Pyramimonas_sp.AAC.1